MVIYGTGKPEHLRDASEAFEKKFSELDERLISRIMQTQLYKAYEAEKNKEFLEL